MAYTIKEDTRKRCKIQVWLPELAKKFCNISLEQYHFLQTVQEIDFCIYLRIEQELIEYIRPSELSQELLEQIWKASLKPNVRLEIYVQKKDLQRFHLAIEKVRDNKIKSIAQKDPALDTKTLSAFSNLSGASQQVVRGGITADVAARVAASATYMMTNLINNDLAMTTISRMISIDPTLYDHSAAVTMFSCIIASQYLKTRLDSQQVNVLTQCALYHDTGKTCVPSSILNKPDKLTEAEFTIMKSHAELGSIELRSAIERGAPINELACTVALEHHERMAGGGYPHGKKGRAEDKGESGIHLYSRIVAIADVYSALLMQRVYKPAMSSEKSIELMARNAPADFDLDIFGAFLQTVRQSNSKMQQRIKERSSDIFDLNSKETLASQIQRKKNLSAVGK